MDCSTDTTESAGVVCKSCELIHSRICELLNAKTQEEDQARVHNAWSLLLELAEQCDIDESRVKSKPLIVDSIQNELKRALKRERELGFLRPAELDWPPYAALIAGFSAQDKEWSELSRLARFIGSSLRATSITSCIGMLKDHNCPSIDMANPHVLDELCEYWVTDLRWSGISSAQILLQIESVPASQVLSRMALFPADEKTYTIILPVKGVNEIVKNSGFAPADESLSAKAIEVVGDRFKNHVLAQVSVVARDPNIAARLGRQIAERFLSIIALMRANQEVSVLDPVVVVDNDGNSSIHATVLPSGYPHLSRSAKSKQWWPDVTGPAFRNGDEGMRALDVALRHHWLSCSAPTIDSRIVNLWTAFEALFADGNQATSVSVAETVSCMVSGAYVRNMLRRLGIDLARGTESEKNALQAALAPISIASSGNSPLKKSSSKIRFSPENLAVALASKQDSVVMDAMYKAVTDNPLLVRKITRARRVMKSPNALGERIGHHRETVDWQIRRIYRARNSIVHGRVSLPLTVAEPLLRHAHHYLSLTLHQIIHGVLVTGNPLEAVIKRARSAYSFIVSGLKMNTTKVSYRGLTDPDWWGAPCVDPSLWDLAASRAPVTASRPGQVQ